MSDKEELDVSLEGEMTSKHLLALVLEYRELHESEAQRKLQVGLEQIKKWKVQLQAEGLLEADDATVDSTLKITKAGLKRLKAMENEWIAQEAAQEPKPEKISTAGKLGSIFASTLLHSQRLKETFLDGLILSATLMSLYLLKLFFDDPNVQVMSFLVSTSLFAVVLVVYQQYKKDLKSREFIGFFNWVTEQSKSNRRHIVAVLVVLLVVYSVGMIVMTKKNAGLYVLLSVLAASSILVLFAPKKSLWMILKFYLGVALLVSGLMLLAGLFSVTGYLAQTPIWWVDILFGLGILFVAHLNEKTLGLAALSRKH